MTNTDQLIQLASLLTPSGEIGDGMVARFHALAKAARAEQPEGPHVGDGSGDAALAIGEDAFRAGFRAACKAWDKPDDLHAEEEAWGEYDPPEHIKALS